MIEAHSLLARRILGRVVVYYVVICVVLGICLGELAFSPPRTPFADRPSFQATAARFGATLQDVSVTASDGAVLRAWYARPAADNGNSVLLLHGIGDNRDGMTGFAELFLSKGYAVLLPDLRAHGACGGRYPTYGVKETADVQDWFQWLVSQQHPACVFGMGESMGAAIVLQAVRTSAFCGVVAESPFASLRRLPTFASDRCLIQEVGWAGLSCVQPLNWFLYGRLTRHVDLSQVSPKKAVAKTSVPILLIHGLADHNIPVQQSEMIRSQIPVT